MPSCHVVILFFQRLLQADHYKMAIQEKGTPFSEDIDIDETQDVEVFRVPAANDVEGADFYHDFKLVSLEYQSQLCTLQV